MKIGYALADIQEMSRAEMNARLLAHNRLLTPRGKKTKWASETKVKRRKKNDEG